MSDGKAVRVLDPATGEVRSIAPGEAQQAFASGQGKLLAGDEIALTAHDGTTMVAPAAKVEEALRAGWRFAEASDVLREKAKNQKVQATVEGAASQLTLGVSDAGLRAAGVEGLAERRDTTAGQVGEGLGLAGALLGPGLVGKLGVGAAKAAAGAALAPMTAVTAAGNAIEAAASKALGQTLTNNAVRGALASGLGRAAEGAAFGAGGALSEASLGDADVNAQHLLAAAGSGALVGGLFGAASGTLRGMSETRAIKAQYRPRNPEGSKFASWSAEEVKAAADVAGLELTDKAAGKWAPKIQRLLADASEKFGGYNADAVMSLHTPRARAILRDVDKHLDGAARSFKGVLDRVVESQSSASEAVFERLRPAMLDKIPAGSTGASIASAADALSSMRNGLNDIVDNAHYAGLTPERAAAAVRPQLDLVEAAENKILKAAGFANPERVRLDVVAKARGQAYEKFRAQYEASGVDPSQKWNFLRDGMRDMTEHSGAYAGATQEQIDAIAAGQAGTMNRGTPFEPITLQEGAARRGFDHTLVDGRHRLAAAQAAGASHIAATIDGQARLIPLRGRGGFSPNPAELNAIEQAGKDAQRDLLGSVMRGMSSDAVPPAAVKVAFEEIERAKRLFAKPAVFESETGAAGARELSDRYRKIYDDARLHLEDSSVYGPVADTQREMNAAYASRADAYKRIKGAFKITDDEFASPSVQSYVRNMDKVRGDDAVAALEQWRDAQKLYADTAEKFFPGSGIQESTRGVLRDFDKAHGELSEIVGVNGTLKALLSRRNQLAGFGGLSAGPVGGAIVGGLPGAAVGAVAQAVLDPGRFALQAANATRSLEQIQSWIASKAGALTGVGETVAKLPWTPVLSKLTTRMLEGKPAERQEAYDERVRELQGLSDPTAYATHASTQLLGTQDVLPNHGAAMSATGQRAVQILLSSMPAAHPASAQAGVMGALYGTPRPTDRDLLKFAQVDRAVQHPLSVIERAARGEPIQAHEVAALEAVYPKVLQSVRISVSNSLGAAKRPPRAAVQRNLNMLLGVPDVDPTRLRSWQSVHSQPQKPPAPPRGAQKPRSASVAAPTESFESYARR